MGTVEYCANCMNPLGQGKFCPSCGKDRNEKSHAAHVIPPGTLLHGRYLIGGVIGQGGFGITYAGRDTVLDSTVAIKECYPSSFVARMAGSLDVVPSSRSTATIYAKCLNRFTDEAKLLGKMRANKSVVDVLDLFEENETAYMVMEKLQGITLEEMLDRFGPMNAATVFGMMTPVLDALQEMHNIGLLHRDLSPDNIMITQDNRAVLMDFGAARTVDWDSQNSLSVVLKPSYAPTEQYDRNGNQGPWSDIYALCASMYRCITGVVPQNSLKRLAEDDLKAPSQLGVDISPAQEQALMRGLSVRAADRQQSASQLKEELLLGRGGKVQHPTSSGNSVASASASAATADAPAASAGAYETIPMTESWQAGQQAAQATPANPAGARQGNASAASARPNAAARSAAASKAKPSGPSKAKAKPASSVSSTSNGSSSSSKAKAAPVNAAKPQSKPSKSAKGKSGGDNEISNAGCLGFFLVVAAVIFCFFFHPIQYVNATDMYQSSGVTTFANDSIQVNELGRYVSGNEHIRVVEVTNNGNEPVSIIGKSRVGKFELIKDSTPVLDPGDSSLLMFEYSKAKEDRYSCKDTYTAKAKKGRESASSDVSFDFNFEDGNEYVRMKNTADKQVDYDLFFVFYKDDALVDVKDYRYYHISALSSTEHPCKSFVEHDKMMTHFAADKDSK